ncbi:hypothetical protein EV647_0338 [Kribbella sp. VKM Ac-2566]|nr:hypothetical protein EV647_0338 [Kribbella sp. VKM Ac-2566]
MLPASSLVRVVRLRSLVRPAGGSLRPSPTGRGLTNTRDLRFSQLDLSDIKALPDSPPIPVGTAVTSWAEVGPAAVYHVCAAATADEPNDIAVDAMPYDEWLAEIWQAPESDLDVSTVVPVDGRAAAYTLTEADYGSNRVWSGGMGTLWEHRGQGLARIAKCAALRQAAAAGVQLRIQATTRQTGRCWLLTHGWDKAPAAPNSCTPAESESGQFHRLRRRLRHDGKRRRSPSRPSRSAPSSTSSATSSTPAAKDWSAALRADQRLLEAHHGCPAGRWHPGSNRFLLAPRHFVAGVVK